jgi:hypothetical protein
MNHLAKEVVLIKSKFWENFIKGSSHMLYHLLTLGLSAAFVLSLPLMVRFVTRKFLVYWPRIGNEKIFFLCVEMLLGVLFIVLFNVIRKGWRDRRLSNMARAAGMVLVTSARGFLVRRKIRRLKESQGIARDVMVISSTGFRTFVNPDGELHLVIQNCRKAKIMLLNPNGEGARVRAKGIPNPDVTPESLRDQITKSIDFLKSLKAAQKDIRLKLYPDPPFLKMTILGDYIWLQHYQPGVDLQGLPKYVFKHDPNLSSLYFPFYRYFVEKWNSPDIPEYDLEADELIYRDNSGKEVRREKFVHLNGMTSEVLTNGNPRKDDREPEGNESFSPLSIQENGGWFNNFLTPGRRHLHGGLHPGGKEFFLLRSKNPICETSSWINIL